MKIINLLKNESVVERGEKMKGKMLLENKMSEDRKVCCSLFDVIIKLVLVTKQMETVYGATISDLEMIEAQKRIILRAISIIEDTINMCDIFEEIETDEILKTESLNGEKLPADFIPTLKLYNIVARLNTIIEGYDTINSELDYEMANEISLDITRIETALVNIETLITEKLKNKLSSM